MPGIRSKYCSKMVDWWLTLIECYLIGLLILVYLILYFERRGLSLRSKYN